MKQNYSNYFNSRKNAHENSNVESNDSFREFTIQVPYGEMSKVAEGLKNSFINNPVGTSLILQDNTYNISMAIMWVPRIIEEEKGMCQMDAHAILLYHYDKRVREWNDSDKYESINYRHIQNAINSIVEKDIKRARQRCVDNENPLMKYWMTGGMVACPVIPSDETIKRLFPEA